MPGLQGSGRMIGRRMGASRGDGRVHRSTGAPPQAHAGVSSFSALKIANARLPAHQLLPPAVLRVQMCHATACWMTCGKVEGLEVHTDEGGVCKFRGGQRWLITPAGYLGGAFW